MDRDSGHDFSTITIEKEKDMPTKLKVSYGPFLPYVSLVTPIVPNFHYINKKVVILRWWMLVLIREMKRKVAGRRREVVFASSSCISAQKQTHLM